ncbi:hypothetical protein QBA75_17790 [Streptomyces stelliscabiei]
MLRCERGRRDAGRDAQTVVAVRCGAYGEEDVGAHGGRGECRVGVVGAEGEGRVGGCAEGGEVEEGEEELGGTGEALGRPEIQRAGGAGRERLRGDAAQVLLEAGSGGAVVGRERRAQGHGLGERPEDAVRVPRGLVPAGDGQAEDQVAAAGEGGEGAVVRREDRGVERRADGPGEAAQGAVRSASRTRVLVWKAAVVPSWSSCGARRTGGV